MTKEGQPRIFDRQTELVFLGIPFLLLLGAIFVEKALGLEVSPTGPTRYYSMWICNVLFLGAIHPVFTFRNILLMPECRQVLKAQGYSWWKLSTLSAGLFLLVLFCSERSVLVLGPGFGVAFRTFLYFATNVHLHRQSVGISLLYNKKMLNSAGSLSARKALEAPERTARKLEHWAVWPLIVGFTITQVRTAENYAWLANWEYPFYALSLALFTSAILEIPSAPCRRKKALFLARLLPFFLIPTSPILLFFYQSAQHSLEYLFITNLMYKNSRVQLRKDAVLLGIVLTIFLGMFKVTMGYKGRLMGLHFLPTLTSDATMRSAALAVAYSMRLMHVFLDFVLFQMKNPVNRKLISPLLETELPERFSATEAIEAA